MIEFGAEYEAEFATLEGAQSFAAHWAFEGIVQLPREHVSGSPLYWYPGLHRGVAQVFS